jgi:hypothetical protein
MKSCPEAELEGPEAELEGPEAYIEGPKAGTRESWVEVEGPGANRGDREAGL